VNLDFSECCNKEKEMDVLDDDDKNKDLCKWFKGFDH